MIFEIKLLCRNVAKKIEFDGPVHANARGVCCHEGRAAFGGDERLRCSGGRGK